MCVDGDREHGCDGQPRDQDRECVADAARERVATGEPVELTVGRPDPVEHALLRAVDHELGCGPQNVDDLGGELAPGGRLPTAGRTPQAAGGPRHGDASQEKSRGKHEPRVELERRSRADADGSCGDRDERRPDPAEVETLKRIHVAHHPAHQIAATELLEAGRRKGLDPFVEAGADTPECSQGEVVGVQAVRVTRERPSEAEEPHRDDRRGQRENRRPFGCARDEVARGGHQADAEDDRERSESDGDGRP